MKFYSSDSNGWKRLCSVLFKTDHERRNQFPASPERLAGTPGSAPHQLLMTEATLTLHLQWDPENTCILIQRKQPCWVIYTQKRTLGTLLTGNIRLNRGCVSETFLGHTFLDSKPVGYHQLHQLKVTAGLRKTCQTTSLHVWPRPPASNRHAFINI